MNINELLKTYPITKLSAMVEEVENYGRIHCLKVSNDWNALVKGFSIGSNPKKLYVDIYFQYGNTDADTSVSADTFFRSGEFRMCERGATIRFSESEKCKVITDFVEWFEKSKEITILHNKHDREIRVCANKVLDAFYNEHERVMRFDDNNKRIESKRYRYISRNIDKDIEENFVELVALSEDERLARWNKFVSDAKHMGMEELSR